MSNRLAAVALLVALVSTSACTPGRAAIAAGAGSLVLGGLSLAAGQPNSTCTGGTQCGFVESTADSIGDEFDEGQRELGAGMMVVGAGLILVGLIAERDDSEDEPLPASALAFAPAQRVGGAPGATTGPAATVEGTATVGGTAIVERTATPAEMALRSRLENRLAIQASFTARRGDCVAAVATSTRLAEVDPAMHAELIRTDADLAHCLALAAARQY